MDSKEYYKKYAAENKERLDVYKSEWKKERLKDPEYRARQNELQKIRRATKGTSVEMPHKIRERVKAWKKANPEKVVAATTARKRYIKQRTPKWLSKDDMWMMEQAYELAALRTKIFGFAWHVDHIIPLRANLVSGLHTPYNLTVIPKSVNLTKSNKFEV